MPFSAPGQRFSNPANDPHVMTSWERFLTGGEVGANALRRLVDDSWRRCLGGSVDPRRDQAPPPMREDSLLSLRDDSHELLLASQPVMASARDVLSETGTVMVLTNDSGVILNLEGDASLRGAAENVHLLSGATWSEMTCGTNAIGTALVVGQPVQIHSAEHYCSGIKRWSCSANVIRDPCDGRILGVVDVSGLTDTFNRHSLALVVATAGRIENRLAELEMEARFQLIDHCMETLSASQDGIVVFDRRGRPIKANGAGTTALSALGALRGGGGTGEDAFAGLRLDWRRGRELPDRLPDWLERDWLQPVVADGERLGLVLTLPARRGAHGMPAARAAAAAGRPAATEDRGAFARLVGASPALGDAVTKARQLARSRAPVLLLGETGVGKDVFAEALHKGGPAPDGPFVALNCGGFSRELLSSELFGYAEGAFTGARRGGMTGKIEAADGGTLFLDEIGEMPIDLQPHFLRVLESGEVYRIGETRPRKVNFRLVAATNRDLRAEIEAGRFRMDLFYRVAVTSIRVPPLRERAGDVALIAAHFLRDLAARLGQPERRLSPGLAARLEACHWPGNVRELRNVLESMVLMSSQAVLTEADLPSDLMMAAPAFSFAPATAGGPAAPAEVAGLTRMEVAERDALLKAMRDCRGNMTAVTRSLGIAKSTVYAKLKRFGLEAVMDGLRRENV
ncbi:sigma-54-dependent Fis family transcriptional regulator [Pseudoxanthobacter sp.]|uniref:sigma-54-dependent Fis family transcriptional regulator n=1 Tax=Pseudoxanthobacter sp. TaxID=1925742 RepID=UPI002FE2D759